MPKYKLQPPMSNYGMIYLRKNAAPKIVLSLHHLTAANKATIKKDINDAYAAAHQPQSVTESEIRRYFNYPSETKELL